MKRQSIALFLSTMALAGGTVACGQQSGGGKTPTDHDQKQLTQPAKPAAASQNGAEGGEGGEGGEG